jgi:hypothetical protein
MMTSCFGLSAAPAATGTIRDKAREAGKIERNMGTATICIAVFLLQKCGEAAVLLSFFVRDR